MNFHIKKFCRHAKSVKTVKPFCLETFVVYGSAHTVSKYLKFSHAVASQDVSHAAKCLANTKDFTSTTLEHNLGIKKFTTCQSLHNTKDTGDEECIMNNYWL